MNPEKSKGKKNRSRIARSSKRKGKQFEGKIAKMFNEWFCPDDKGRIHRTPSSGNFVFPGDIFDVKEKLPFLVECKKRRHLPFSSLLEERSELWKFWNQALDECDSKHIPLLIFGEDYGPDYFMMDLEVFLGLEDWNGEYPERFLEIKGSGQDQNAAVGFLQDFLAHFDPESVKAYSGGKR